GDREHDRYADVGAQACRGGPRPHPRAAEAGGREHGSSVRATSDTRISRAGEPPPPGGGGTGSEGSLALKTTEGSEMNIDIAGISRSFGDRRVLDDVSFGVEGGRMTGFVGGNGAGKTTTMRIILGVLAADAGTVSLDGTP